MHCLLDLGPALAIDNFPHAVHKRGIPVKGVDDPAFVRSVAGVGAVQYRLDRPELVVSSGLQKRQSIQVRGSSSILAKTCISTSSIDDKALCCSPRWFGSRLKLPKVCNRGRMCLMRIDGHPCVEGHLVQRGKSELQCQIENHAGLVEEGVIRMLMSETLSQQDASLQASVAVQ